jgi:hypothetical protein
VKARTPPPAGASHEPAGRPSVLPEHIAVSNRLVPVQDTVRAADLFARILRAVRAEKADQEKNCNGIVEP